MTITLVRIGNEVVVKGEELLRILKTGTTQAAERLISWIPEGVREKLGYFRQVLEVCKLVGKVAYASNSQSFDIFKFGSVNAYADGGWCVGLINNIDDRATHIFNNKLHDHKMEEVFGPEILDNTNKELRDQAIKKMQEAAVENFDDRWIVPSKNYADVPININGKDVIVRLYPDKDAGILYFSTAFYK